MKLLFRQKMFSWFDSFDVYDEQGQIYYSVRGALSWGHLFNIYDRNNVKIGTLKEEFLHFLPTFCMYKNNQMVGKIQKRLTFLLPKLSLTCNDWVITGDMWQWNYLIKSKDRIVAAISKKLLRMTDTYVLDINDENDALLVLMIVISIDAIKCNQENNR